MKTLFRALGLLLFAISFLPADAMAQTPQSRTVSANEGLVLDHALVGQITGIQLAPNVGTAKTTADPSGEALLYLAPPTPQSTPVILTYTKGGATYTYSIDVVSPAVGLTGAAYDASFKALFVLFVLAVLLESGLALLFHWKPYLAAFDTRTVNALVSFAVAFIFINAFDLDIVSGLLNSATNKTFGTTSGGEILTALIVAGGSAGVNTLFRALGFRAPLQTQDPPPKLERNEAWVSVSLVRKSAVGPVDVLIGPPGASAVAGTIAGSAGAKTWFRLVLRDQGRFPPSGGHTVNPGTNYEISLRGKDNAGKIITSEPWGPSPLAERAIVDIELAL